MLRRDEIGRRAAREVGVGMVVNRRIGTPRLAAIDIWPELGAAVQSENGVLGIGPFPLEGSELVELAPGVDVEEGVRAATGAALQVSPELRVADAGADPAPATEGGRV